VRNGRTPGGRQRWACKTHDSRSHSAFCYTTTSPKSKGVRKPDGSEKRSRKAIIFKRAIGEDTVKFLISSAQNATPRHKGFIKTLENAANAMDVAEIYIIPMRYKNPTSRWEGSQKNDEYWDVPQGYLCNQRKRLNKNLVLMGDVKIAATAAQPLSRFEAITHGESGIFGHPKLQLKTVPTPQSRMPKILTTTGSCTVPNYTDTALGKLGAFHYTLGAALVETRGKMFHLRQINAEKKTGHFIDLDCEYGQIATADAEDALVLAEGDTHVDFVDPAVDRATREIVGLLRPRVIAWHDLLDGYAVNPHHMGNVFIAIAKIKNGRVDARAEMERAFRYLQAHTPSGTQSVVVPSNHIDFLTRWILNTDPRSQPGNFKFWCETALAMEAGTIIDGSGTNTPNPFNYWGRKYFEACSEPESAFLFLERDESYEVAGIELGMHGDKGPNGARGSRMNLRRIGVKSIIGHTHSPGIEEGCYQVGTSTALNLEYTSGPSSWLNTHCIVYANGKRTLINIVNGEWHL
jgi:hypothetical protein